MIEPGVGGVLTRKRIRTKVRVADSLPLCILLKLSKAAEVKADWRKQMSAARTRPLEFYSPSDVCGLQPLRQSSDAELARTFLVR